MERLPPSSLSSSGSSSEGSSDSSGSSGSEDSDSDSSEDDSGFGGKAAWRKRFKELEYTLSDVVLQKQSHAQLKRLKQAGNRKQFEFIMEQHKRLQAIERGLQGEPGKRQLRETRVLVDEVLEALEKRKTDLFIAERGGWELVKEYHEGGPIFDGDKETVKAQDARLKAAIARMQTRGLLP